MIRGIITRLHIPGTLAPHPYPAEIMHYSHSRSLIRRYRIAALLFLGSYLLAAGSFFLLGYSLLTDNRRWIMIGIGFILLSMALVVSQWVAVTGTGCPLCRTPVLALKTCMKHRRAKTLLGSHRLRVSLAILFKGKFSCPNCNESSQLRPRETMPGHYQDHKR